MHFGKNDIPQVAQVHVSPDGSVFKGLQQELIKRSAYYYYTIVGNIINTLK